MLIVEFDAKEGIAVPDGRAVEFIDDLIKEHATSSYLTVKVGCESVIYALRLAILEEKISHESVLLVFESKHYTPNKYAVIENWPRGFADLLSDMAVKIIKAQSKLRKKDLFGAE